MIDWMFHLPAIIVVIPLLSAIIVALLPSRIGWICASISSGLSFWAAIVLTAHMLDAGSLMRMSYFLGGWPPPWGIEFSVDHATTLVILVITGLGFVSTLSSNALLLNDIHSDDRSRFFAAWLLTLGGLLGLVMTADAFNLFVFFEISSLASVTLVAMGSGRDKRALVAAFNYLVIGAIGATFYVIGVGFCYAMTGTLNMVDMANRLPLVTDLVPVYIGLAFMVSGVMVKAAVFPVHFWLPPSYGFAPMAVTSLLAAIATKAALYVLIRIMMTIFGGFPDMPLMIMQWVFIPLALMAILLGTVLAIYEKDAKMMLAQSSVAQIGYIVLGFGVATLAGVQSGFIHIANHAMIKGGMFIGLGGMAIAVAGKTRMTSLAGLGRRMPITSTGFLICGLSLIGVPLTAGFFSKFYLVSAIIAAGYWQIAAIVLLSSALSVIYLWRLVETLWFAPADGVETRLPEQAMIYIPLWILAIANIWFGINAGMITGLAKMAATSLFGGMS